MDLVVVALAASAIAPWWSVAVPATLTLLYLVLCRRQVSRESQALWYRIADPRLEELCDLVCSGVRERAEAAGGRLALESAPGKGPTVRVRVPL